MKYEYKFTQSVRVNSITPTLSGSIDPHEKIKRELEVEGWGNLHDGANDEGSEGWELIGVTPLDNVLLLSWKRIKHT